ncbi:MAG: hypothetical protein GY761_01445 [Hyphomicrobiales bacterium]|nr:hypothetical protein [Hyphomicrobiales bacterium]
MVNTSDLIAYTSDPAFSLDDEMCVTGWNDGARELLGYTDSEICGMTCAKVLQAFYLTGEPLCSMLCEGRSCIISGKKWGINNCLVRHKNGEMIPTRISSLVLPIEARIPHSKETVAVIILHKVQSETVEAAPENPLRIFALGTFALAVSGKGLNVENWKRKKAITVLKCLISHLNKPVHRERLIEWIWPDADPDKSWARLKVTVSYLRQALREGGVNADIIETKGQSYLLRSNLVWIDSDEFCALVSKGREMLRANDLAGAKKHLEDAESLYRGEFIEDEPYSDWCIIERERLREIYLELLDSLAICYIETGSYTTAARICRTALSSDPCRESFIRTLMKSMISMGRPDWARASFVSWRRSLEKEYGLSPTEETLAIFRYI